MRATLILTEGEVREAIEAYCNDVRSAVGDMGDVMLTIDVKTTLPTNVIVEIGVRDMIADIKYRYQYGDLADKKVHAIKAVREATGLGLKESKAMVDDWPGKDHHWRMEG